MRRCNYVLSMIIGMRRWLTVLATTMWFKARNRYRGANHLRYNEFPPFSPRVSAEQLGSLEQSLEERVLEVLHLHLHVLRRIMSIYLKDLVKESLVGYKIWALEIVKDTNFDCFS